MKLIESFVRNPVKVSVGVLIVGLFGVISLWKMPVQLSPEVQVPTISVRTSWPGASPQEIEREIVQEQEEQLQSVEGLTRMTSQSADSSGSITLEFSVGTDLSEAILRVNTRLQQVPEYPEDADEPVISASSSASRPIAWFVLSQTLPGEEKQAEFLVRHPQHREALDLIKRTDNPSLAVQRMLELAKDNPEVQEIVPEKIEIAHLRRFVEDFIESRFERVAGVADSNIFGGRSEEMQVVVDPQRLASRKLTVLDVRRALNQQNLDVSGGDFWEGKRRYVVRTLGQFRSPEQVGNCILSRREDSTIYVRDVAEVRLGFKKPSGVVRRFGGETIAINVQRETGANVLSVMKGLYEAQDSLNKNLLAQRGLVLFQAYDETEYIDSSIQLVNQNMVVGGILTVFILLLFLRSGRSTLIVGLAIPTSVVGTFLLLGLMGRSLNVMSLAGMAFAVGMLVDNAVVVLENIYRHHQAGESAARAAVNGATEVWGAVVASTLTTLAVFVPVLFVEEEAGQLFRDIALAISAAVGLSLLVSVIVIPTAAKRILGRSKRTIIPLEGGSNPEGHLSLHRPGSFSFLRPFDFLGHGFVNCVVKGNRWLLDGVVRRIVFVILLISISGWMSWALMPKVEYLPSGNRNLIFGIILPPPGYNVDEMVKMGSTIEEGLRPYWDVDPDLYDPETSEYPPIADFFFVAAGRSLFMGLRCADPLRCGELVPLVQKAVGELPGTFVVAKQSSLFEQGLTGGRTIDIEVVGPDIEHLITLGSTIMGGIGKSISGAQARPSPSLDLSSPEVHVIPRWEQAAELGLSASDLGYAVNALVDGAYAGDYFAGGDKIDLTIMGKEQYAQRTQDLESLPIATPRGDLVRLGTIARVQLASGPEQINRSERQRTITIEVTPPPEIALESAMERIQSEILGPLDESGALSGGYQIRLAGTADKLNDTWVALRLNLLLAVLITYLLMAALFESWVYPLVIILSVPFGAVGGFLGLWVLNRFLLQPLDVLTMLGFVILIGTVVNNAILIVHQSLNILREKRVSSKEAVLESVRTRIRPIFMTTLTSVFGLSPLVLFPGAGSELYRGLGSVVLGGLLVSSLFTLFLVPTLFSLTLETKEKFRRGGGEGDGEEGDDSLDVSPTRRTLSPTGTGDWSSG